MSHGRSNWTVSESGSYLSKGNGADGSRTVQRHPFTKGQRTSIAEWTTKCLDLRIATDAPPTLRDTVAYCMRWVGGSPDRNEGDPEQGGSGDVPSSSEHDQLARASLCRA